MEAAGIEPPRKIPAVFESGWCRSPDPAGRFAQRVARVGKKWAAAWKPARPHTHGANRNGRVGAGRQSLA